MNSYPLCIYHGYCADGFAAAWAVGKAFPTVEYHAGVYGSPPPDVTGRDVLIVDFSYKRPILDEMATKARTITVLDHHKTAAEDLAGLPPPIDGAYNPDAIVAWQQECNSPNALHALFDMNRSGAQITWDYLHPTMPRPLLVDYVGDRDLWRFKLPLSREVNAYVSAFEQTLGNWDHLDRCLHDHMDVQRIAEMGGAIDLKHRKDIVDLVKVSRRTMVIGGHTVPVANLPGTMASDAGNLMAAGEKFAATYYDAPDGRRFSLRSTDAGLDVSAIAKQYGGGGHRNASGFKARLGWEGELPA